MEPLPSDVALQGKMPANFEIIQLKNGTFSVRSILHNETFHPVVGPVAEAEALYVGQLRLVDRIASTTGDFIIWDVGLGAAANVISVLRAVRRNKAKLRIISFDCTIEPLEFALKHANRLGYINGYEEPLSALVKQGKTEFANDLLTVDWRICLGDFPTLLEQSPAKDLPVPHAILFDAYSPAKNPSMWTLSVFQRVFQFLPSTRSCALATYSRSTMLRVSLLLAGFYVGAGSATGEKEETTIAATKLDLIELPLDRKWLKRARNSTSAEPLMTSYYRQAPLSEGSWECLIRHPQFA